MTILKQPDGTYNAYFHGLKAPGYTASQAIINAIALAGLIR